MEDEDEARIQIHDLEQKEEISIQPEQQKEKKNRKKNQTKVGIRCPLGHLQKYQHPNHTDARRRREEQEIENLFEKIMKENFLIW